MVLQQRRDSKKRLQHRFCPVNIAKFLRTPILKNIYEWLPSESPYTHFMSLVSSNTPMKTSKNESLRYFQWVYKGTSGIKWATIPLYKNKEIFVCVSVDYALKLSDLLPRKVFITCSFLSFFAIIFLHSFLLCTKRGFNK